ncbi:MAG: 6-bladed beta-propeller [Planctomycetota bacterium]
MRCCVFIALSILILSCLGCGRPAGELFSRADREIVWPGAPEQPRIRYVGQLSTEEDLNAPVSFSEGFKRAIFGKKDIGIMVGPYAAALDGKQRLFVADADSGAIHSFDLSKRKYTQFSSTVEDQSLDMPVGLAIAEGRLYVVDSALHKICVFDEKGNFEFSFGEDQLKRPSGIAYHPSSRKIYVCDTGSHAIKAFDMEGNYLESMGRHGSEPAEFNYPTHLWVGREGKLYVSDTLNYRVQIFSDSGEFLSMFGRHGDRLGQFAHPAGIATDTYGNIYVADRQFESMQIFDKDGRFLMNWGSEGSDPGEFWLPGGVFIDETNRIFVADSFNKRVQVFELLEQGANEQVE